MIMTEMLDDLKKRIGDNEATDELLQQILTTVHDRLCLRLGSSKLPELFISICVDASVKMYRRTYFEGISSEGVANISTSFVEDILQEYEREIDGWKETQANSGSSGKVVYLL